MTLTSRLKNWFLKAPLGQAVLLAFIQAYGWLWIHVVALSFITDTLNAEAAGIGVIFVGWIWALLWGWIVCWPISRRIIGGPSIAGYTTAAVLQLPGLVLIFILLIAVPAIRLQLPSMASSIPILFKILGLGILPEGRQGFSGIHTFMFLAMFAIGTFGFYLTAIRWRKAHEALKSLVLIGGVFFGLVKATYAYDIPTHKTFLTERSAILLHKDSGQNYQELLNWKSNLMTGTGDEDGGFNFLEHFYRPSDGVGLWSDPRLPKPLNTSALNRLLGQSPLRAFEADPAPYFASAVEEYMSGHKSDAYLILGRTLHLATQDMFSPPHTHNDAHLNVSDKCFFEGIGLDPVCPGNRAQNSYEGWTSENFNRNTTDSRAAGTGIDPSVRNLVPAAADVGSLLDHNAQSTYKMIRVQGTLNKSATNPANGTLAAMFPAFDPVTNPNGMTYEMECSKWSALFNVCIPMHIWTIKGVGEMHEHEGGQGDSITDHWWKAQNFSANDPGEYYYLENPKTAFPRQYNGATTSGESLAELWALGPRGRDPETAKGLMARSQESSAGLMKRFAELVDAIPPDILIKDSAGRLIAANGSSKSPEILITAIDPVNEEQPTASGIYKVVLTQVAGHFSSTWNFTGMPNGVVGADTRELNQVVLSPASYIVTAHDGLGNQKSVRFMISPFSPAGELNINASAVTIDAVAGTFSASLGIDLFDPTGISSVTLTKAASPEDIVTNLTVDSNVPGATARVTPVVGTPFSSAVGDLYTLEVYNSAGDAPVESGFFLSGDSGVDLFQFSDSVERPSALTMTGMAYASGGLRLTGTQGEFLSEIIPTQRPSSDGEDSEKILLGAVLTAASGGGGAFGFEYSPLESGPASSAQPPGGQLTVGIRTGDTPAAVSAAAFNTIMSATLPDASVNGLGGGELVLKKYYQISATMNTSGGNCAEAECSSACPTEQPNCHIYYSNGAPFPIVYGVYGLPGYDVHASKPFNVSPGTNVSLTMEPSAPNVQLTIPQVNRLGNVIAGYYIVPGPSDKNTLPLDQAVSIRNEADVTGPIAIKINYGESVTLTDEEAAGLTIVRTDPLTGESTAIDAVVVSTTEHTVAGTFVFSGPGNFGTFQVQYPKIAPPVPVASVNWVGDGPEFQILATPGDLAVATVPQSDPQVSAAIPAAATAGLSLISNVYQTQTTAASFQPAGEVVFRFNSSSPAMESISPASLKIYQLDPILGAFVLLSPQVLDQAGQSITVSVSTPGIYAIFGSPEASSSTLASLEIEPSSATFLVGESAQFAALAFYTDGSTAPILAAWSSDAPDIATITASGFATALATGTAQITASSGSVTAATSLTVAAPSAELASLQIDPSSATVRLGDSGQFSAIGFFTDGSTAPVAAVWSSDAPEVATITASGFATALATGSAQITASSGAVSAATSLTIVPPPLLALFPAHGSTVTVNPPLIVADFSQFGPGLDAASLRLELDGVDVTTSAAVHASSMSFSPGAALAEGTHETRFQASDFDENLSSAAAAFFIDSLPPVTALLVNGLPAGAGTVVLTTTDALSFSAEDAGTGAMETLYSLNGGATQAFLTPFTVGVGTHALEFASRDFAGNEETPQSVELAVSSVPAAPPPEVPSGGGLAVAADPTGNLWEVVRSTDGEFRLVKLDGDGGTLAAVVLPGASDDGRWSVLFDSLGAAHAIGSSADPSTNESRVAVYRTDAAGQQLLSSATFNAPSGTNSFAFDAAGGFRIAGVLLEGDEENFTAALALWKYDPQTNLLELTTTYGGAAFDVGLGVRLDDGGNIWVIGYSSNAATPGPNRLDLALWKFDPSGTALLAGPFLRPGYLRNPDDRLGAALVFTGQTFLAAASKLNEFGNTDLAFHKFDLAGEVVYERLWHGAAGLDEVPRAMALDPEGKALIVGGTGAQENFELAAWRYGQDGVFHSAETSAGAGEAQGLAVSGPDAWLAVATSTALVRFTGGTPLSGAEGAQAAGPADVLPPRTDLLIGTPQFVGDRLYVASATLFGFSAEDDFASIGDGAGSGVLETRYAVDAGAFELFTASFSVATGGERSLSWFSRDVAGNTEATRSTSVFVDSTPPATQLYVGGLLVSVSSIVATSTDVFTLAAADEGSGVSGTLYSIDQGAVQAYGSGFVLSAGTHSVSFESVDRVGNAENQRSVFVDVAAPLAPGTGSLEGDIAYGGARSGLYVVRASTDPAVLFDASSFQGPPHLATAAVAGPSYRLDGLAPGHYHVWIFKDVNGDGLRDRLHEPQSTRILPGGGLAEAYEADVTSGAVARLDPFVMDWGEVSGTITNGSLQSGPVRVQLRDTASGWRWASNSGGFGASPGGPYNYLIGFPTTTALEVTAFVDADNDNALSPGEDFGLTAAPIAVIAGVIASGTDITISSGSGQASSAAPVSAVTFPADGAIVASLLTISGTAYDSDGVAGVDIRIQRSSDGLYWSGVDYGTAAVFVEASGTSNWVLESTASIHSGTGTFIITSRARDLLGSVQTDFPLGVSQVSVTRLLYNVSGFESTSRSSTTIDVAWSPNGNPPGTLYNVHYASGDCSGQNFNGVSDKFSPQTTGTNLTLHSLEPETGHVMHMHVIDADGADHTETLAGDFSGNIVVVTRSPGLGADSTPPVFASCQESPGATGLAGFALSRDASGRLWEVIAESGAMKLARFSAAGAREAAVTLPNATDDGDWSVAFDASGNAYAIGATFGLETGVDVALYRVSPEGDVLLSSHTFDGPFSKNDIALDSTGDAWIAGTIQTSDPAGYQLALWKFCPHANLLSLSTTYAGSGGFDAGSGLALDVSSNIWIVGFSSNPATPGSAKLDLALWKFDPQGQNLLAGPFLRPGYAGDLEFNAKLAVSSAGIFAAATRFDAAGNLDLGFIKYGFDGEVQSERLWRSDNGGQDLVADMALDAQGNIVIAGMTHAPSADERLAVWAYAPSGAFISAQIAAAGPATDIAIGGGQTWLSIKDSNQPYLFTGGGDIPGSDVAVSTIADTLPPRTTLTAGEPSASVEETLFVTSMTLLGFTTIDDRAALDDGLGVGSTQTFYATDAGGYVAYTGVFSLVAEGTHTVSFFSVDLEGNAETPQVKTVGVDLTAPVAVLVASGTAYAFDAVDPLVAGAASGVRELGYLVDVDPESCDEVPEDEQAPPGTCANSVYAGPFTLAVGTHTVYFQVVDYVGNGEEVLHSTFVTVGDPGAALVSIAVTPSSATIDAGLTLQYEATATFTDGSTRTLTGEVAWSTDFSSVATINASGLATGLSEGTALVIASSGSVTAQAVLTVAPPILISIAVTPSTASIAAGLEIQFEATGTFTDASTRTMTGEVVWSTDLSTVATVNTAGLATAAGEGSALVIATSGTITAQAVLTVTPTTLVSIAVTPATASITAGLTAQFEATGTFTDASTRTLTGEVAWSTDLSTVATVNTVGLATGAGEGTALVIASSGAVTAQAVLTVTPATLVSIAVTPASASIAAGTSTQFEATGTFTDASTRTMTGEVAWTTDLSTVATVNTVGLATGAGEGIALVIASSGAITAQAVLTVTPATLVSIALAPTSASIAAGMTAQFDAAGTFTDGSTRTLTGEVTWSTDLSSVATVNIAGLATGVGEGIALIIASSGTITSQAVLTVTPAALVSITVTPPSVSIAAGLTAQFEAAGTFTDGSTRTLTAEVGWSADASSVATVSTNGLATGAGEGTTLVIASSGTITDQAVLTVTPATLLSISVTPATASIAAGLTAQFDAAGTFTDGSTRTLTGEVVWSTDASSVATVSMSGLAAAIGEGTALVIASSGAITAQAVLTVNPPALVSVAVTPESTSIPAGTTAQFEAAGTFTNGSTRPLTGEILWSTDASSVAMINSAGLATGMGEGTTLVIASSSAIMGQATLTVSATYFTTASADGASTLSSSRADMTITAVSPGSAAPADAAAAGQGLVLMTASYYELQPSPVVFDPDALLSFTFDPTSVDTGTISIYRYNGPEWSSAPVAGQTLEISETSLARISGYLSGTSLYAVFALPAAPADTTPPVVSLSFSTPSFTASGGGVTIGTQALISLFALDPSSTVPASGVAQILYAIDAATPSVVYTAPFTLAPGAHAVYFSATDVAGNTSEISSAALSAAESPFVGAFSPSSGAIGIAYSMAGFGFGAYGGANTQVRFGPSTSPVSVWNDASIVGTVPGLSTGVHAVTLERWAGSTVTITAAGTYTVTPLVPMLSVATGPIGLPFTLTGPGFGSFSGTNSRVLFAGATAPVSVWNDATISGTVPGIAEGTTTVVVERQTADGFVARSEPLPFTVTLPSVTAVSPSSAPVGGGFALTGWSFGNYLGTNTQVLIGGATTPVSVWNDASIVGTVPGALLPGEHELVVERRTADGFTARSASVPFTVAGLWLEAVSPSTGAIGIPFTLTGSGFGAYLGADTRVKFGVSTAAVSVWNDTTILGTVPTLATGAYAVTVERQQGAEVSVSNVSTFTVISPAIAAVTPSSGPIGTVFTLSGTAFGPYSGTNTFLLLGGATTPITVWNDTSITATVPGSLTPGVQELVAVRRNADGGLSASNTAYFTVTALSIASVSPSTGAIGIPFTISGSEFGSYLGADSRVRFGVSTAAISVWNDTTISGTVPTLATGAYAVTVERQQGADVSVSNAFTFTVISPAIAAVTPSSGPIGTVFTLSGTAFGPYAGTNTFLLLDGATTPISVWNDTTITATVPGGLTTGVKELTAVRRNADGGLSASNTAYFEVTGMSIASIDPSTGPIGIPFTIKGSQFGVFLGDNTRVRFGVSTAAVSVWNDTTISGTLPALSTGVHAVVVERQQGTDVTFSEPSSFTVTELAVGTLTPSSGPIGVPFTITGAHFGPYAGTNTRLLLGGTTVAVSVWNDTTITGTVPNLEAGSQLLWLERKSGTGVQSSATTYFLVTTPEVATLVPSSAPIGAPFTITGTSFGPYAGTNTQVKFNGVVAPVSIWNDVQIVGTVPGAVSTGPAVLVVERSAGGGVSSSAEQAFEVLRPFISTVSPSYGPAGTVVSLSGHGFGPYGGTATQLLVGGSTVSVSVWNDSTIRWTVTEAFSNGDYPLVVRRTPAGGSVESEPVSFTVGTGYSGASFGFSEPLSLAAQPDINFEGGLNLPADEGGRVETASKAAVEVPANALEEDTEITLKRLRPDGLRTEAAGEDKKRAAGEAIEFGPAGTLFKTPVTIELPYDPALAGHETLLAVHYYDPLRRAWEELPSVVDRVRRVVRAQTAHFSIYQPMGALAPQTAAQDEFYFRDQYAFPNPSRGGAVTFRIQPGLADTVELRVYDLSGRRVHSSTDFTFRGAIDDLNGKGAQNTYDHVWGVSGVGSGVYNYVIKASRAGSSPIVKKGKVGVIK